MDKIEQLKQQKQYEAYVKKKTPQHNVWFNMMKAFFLGGMICLIGQCIYHFCELKKLSPDDCSSWTFLAQAWPFLPKSPIHCLLNGAVPVHLFRLPALPTLLLHLRLNIRRRARFLVLAVRFSRLPDRWSCMGFFRPGSLVWSTGLWRHLVCDWKNTINCSYKFIKTTRYCAALPV